MKLRVRQAVSLIYDDQKNYALFNDDVLIIGSHNKEEIMSAFDVYCDAKRNKSFHNSKEIIVEKTYNGWFRFRQYRLTKQRTHKFTWIYYIHTKAWFEYQWTCLNKFEIPMSTDYGILKGSIDQDMKDIFRSTVTNITEKKLKIPKDKNTIAEF